MSINIKLRSFYSHVQEKFPIRKYAIPSRAKINTIQSKNTKQLRIFVVVSTAIVAQAEKNKSAYTPHARKYDIRPFGL